MIYGNKEQMLNAFKDKINELEGVESSTSINAYTYVDTDGLFGEPGATITEAQAYDYWESNRNYDPSLSYYDSFDAWWKDTTNWLRKTVESATVVGSDSSNIYMLMTYSSDPESGIYGDEFYCEGKFFAASSQDAQAQLAAAKTKYPEFFTSANPYSDTYVDDFNDYFDDGEEVYSSLEALLDDKFCVDNMDQYIDENLPFL